MAKHNLILVSTFLHRRLHFTSVQCTT